MFEPQMSLAELDQFLDANFPQVREGQTRFELRSVEAGGVSMALVAGPSHLRPGGTVSGPTLFALADVAIYVAILAHQGPSAADAVTTGMSINFLRRPRPGTLRAEARLLKLGRRLAVAEVSILADGEDPCAHAVGTYSIPAGDGGSRPKLSVL